MFAEYVILFICFLLLMLGLHVFSLGMAPPQQPGFGAPPGGNFH